MVGAFRYVWLAATGKSVSLGTMRRNLTGWQPSDPIVHRYGVTRRCVRPFTLPADRPSPTDGSW